MHAGRAVRLAAAVLRAPVPVDLGVGAARPGAADRPEVLGGRERDDPLGRHADLLPELDRDLVGPELQLRVAGVHGDPDAIPVELHVLGTNSRRELDRALLEVLPEREVAEHLEERQVVAVEPDLVDVDGPEALLRRRGQRRGRRLEAEEERHLRLHARRREERRVVAGARHERVRRAAQMAPLLEEREEALTQLGGRAHPGILRARSRSGRCRYAAGGGVVGRRLAGVAELLVELALAPRGRVLRDAHRLAGVAPRAERGDAVRHAGGEAADLLHGRRDRGRDRAHRRVGAVGHRRPRCPSRCRACRAGRSRDRPFRRPSRRRGARRARRP